MRVLVENPVSQFEELDRNECMQLLGWEYIGRLATCAPGAAPEVVPVTFVLDGPSVAIRCGARHAARLAGQLASFEIDRVDHVQQTGWSVVASGRLVHSPGDRLAPLRMPIERIRGRRVEPTRR